MNVVKNLSILLVLAFSMINGASAFSGFSDAATPREIQEPAASSAELDLYVDGKSVYHRDGNGAVEYTVDSDGDVCDGNGQIVIPTENVEAFSCIRSVGYDEATTNQTLPGHFGQDSSVSPLCFGFDLTASPSGCLNKTITIESNDPGALYFPYNENTGLFAGVDVPEGSRMPSVTLNITEEPVHLVLAACYEGKYMLTVRNGRDDVIRKIEFVLSAQDNEIIETDEAASQNEETFKYAVLAEEPFHQTHEGTLYEGYTEQTTCNHVFDSLVVEPTFTSGGYTLFTCRYCGAVMIGNETAALTHSHEWDTGTVIELPTCVNEGKMAFVCTACGAARMENIARLPHSMIAQVIPPTEYSEGYTRHYCSVCGYETEHTDIKPVQIHTHTFCSAITQPGCETIGYTTYTCTSCGYSYTDNEVPAHGHSYIVSTVDATCEGSGYSLHSCAVCGASYTDGETPALGHDWIPHTEHKCVRQEGHTICGECGMDFTANGMFGDAVGYHMKEHVLAGGSSRTYETLVDIYDDVTTYTCSRCGAG